MTTPTPDLDKVFPRRAQVIDTATLRALLSP